jgi:hypothetical protein
MFIERNIRPAPDVTNVARTMPKDLIRDMLGSPDAHMSRSACIGCTECDGPCQELLQVLVLPDLILAQTRAHNE